MGERLPASLHSSYLQIIERAVAADTAGGHFERGIDLARRALDLSPESDQIELSLVAALSPLMGPMRPRPSNTPTMPRHSRHLRNRATGAEIPVVIGKVPY